MPVDILHYKGESTEKSSFRYVHVFYEAMLIFFRKHYSGMSLLLSVPIKIAIYTKASVALVKMLSEKMRKSLGFFSPSKRDDAQYILFDADEMSYEDIFREFKQKSDRQVKVAIYTKSIGKVITDSYVVDKEEMPYL